MNWTKDKSIKLSIVCVYVFALVLLAMDIFAKKLMPILDTMYDIAAVKPQYMTYFLLTVYVGSLFGWICLYKMYTLLKNLQKGDVFTHQNVTLLRTISWCFAGAAAVAFISGFYFRVFFLVAVCAAFMMLIVRIVKNAFQQAVEMKDELDLTI